MITGNTNKEKGFTLIELTIVVVIIALLAAIAIPKYMNYICKTKQIEGHQLLGSLAKLEATYHAENDTFTDDLSLIGFSIGGRTHYAYAVTSFTDKAFIAKAEGFPASFNGKADIWTIDESLKITNISNACR